MAKYTVKHLQTGTISIFLGIPMFIQHIFRLTYTTLRLQAIAEKIYLLCYIDHKIHRLSKITSTSIVRIQHHKATAIRVLYNNINFYHLNSSLFQMNYIASLKSTDEFLRMDTMTLSKPLNYRSETLRERQTKHKTLE